VLQFAAKFMDFSDLVSTCKALGVEIFPVWRNSILDRSDLPRELTECIHSCESPRDIILDSRIGFNISLPMTPFE